LGAAGAAAFALAVATVARNQVWRDPLTLWRDAAEKSPNKARPHLAIGNFLRDAGDLAGAEREWVRAAELDPADSAVRNQLGSLAIARGDLRAAEAHLRRALEARGVLPDVYYNLALVLEATGRRAEALAMYRTFVERAPPDRAREVAEVRARFGWR
ncbi:MAG TPA: tetratricopeptide repeat protein, partial [Anaeromyxobacter sp.]